PPPISSLRPVFPPALDRILSNCLVQDPDEHFANAHDLYLQLTWIREAGSQAGVPAPATTRRMGPVRTTWAATSAIIALALAVLVANTFLRQEKKSAIRFPVLPPENAFFPRIPSMSVSPDGHRLAFSAHTSDGKDLIFVRSLDNLTAQPLQGTDDGRFPFWSADSRYLGFFADGKLKKIDITGGPPV